MNNTLISDPALICVVCTPMDLHSLVTGPRDYGKGEYSPGKALPQITSLVPQLTRA
jgi:hypothetical protein